MFKQNELPYAMEALKPYISKETLEFHYGKHHAGYVTKLNAAIENSDYAEKSLEDVIIASREKKDMGVFNNAAQHWNHDFYWKSLSPKSDINNATKLKSAIEKKFDSVDAFKAKFTEAAAGNFGSGWTWLVQSQGGDLEIVNTSNAETPVGTNQTPLFTCDVWEHAYYIDYRNARPDYLKNYWEILNWEFAEKNLK